MKNWAFLVGVVILSQTVLVRAGTVSFKPEVSYPVGTNPGAVVVGDFNRDGKRDLAVVNSGNAATGDNGSVSILYGKGDGIFQAAKNVAIGKNCTSLVAGDFDGDGNDDLALVRPGDATANDKGDVTIFLGNGNGTFKQGQVLTLGQNPSSNNRAIIALDLNGDQRLDLVVVEGTTVSVLLGNGDGSFQPPASYQQPILASSVVAVDLTGNGKKDLAVFGILAVEIWLANGDGTFHQGLTLSNASGRAAGDFNGDKKDDLVVSSMTGVTPCIFPPCNSGGGGIVFGLLLGNGDGTFQPGTTFGPLTGGTGDFDGDGKLDLVGGPFDPSHLLVLPGNGDGTFQQAVSFPVNSNEILSQVLDVNADGAPDLVLIGQKNSIGLLVNVGTDFSISASALSPSTLNPGQSATSNISLSLLSEFDNPVSLSCSVQPARVGAPTCSLSSNSVMFDAGGKASATATINAGSNMVSLGSLRFGENTSKVRFLWMPVVGFAFLGTGLGVGLSRKRRALIFLMGAVLLFGLLAQSGCGGGGSSSGPKDNAYTITVTGTSGASQHSTSVTLTVQ